MTVSIINEGSTAASKDSKENFKIQNLEEGKHNLSTLPPAYEIQQWSKQNAGYEHQGISDPVDAKYWNFVIKFDLKLLNPSVKVQLGGSVF